MLASHFIDPMTPDDRDRLEAETIGAQFDAIWHAIEAMTDDELAQALTESDRATGVPDWHRQAEFQRMPPVAFRQPASGHASLASDDQLDDGFNDPTIIAAACRKRAARRHAGHSYLTECSGV